MFDGMQSHPELASEVEPKPGLASIFGALAQTAYVKAGRGGLDLAGLQGQDLKGFEGAPRGAEGRAMAAGEVQEAVSRSDVDGFETLLGRGFEERAFDLARMGRRGPEAGRTARTLGE
jgi:hypothetical protein